MGGRQNNFKLDPNRTRKVLNGKQVIQQGELARLVAKRAGTNLRDTFEVLKELPEIIKELTTEGYIVNFDNFGNFYVKKVKVPSFSYKEQRGTGMKEFYSLTFKRVGHVSTEINDILLGRDKEKNE